ncbi:cilia- and flagella-associated protein 157-like [Oncorhynchus masou masou]|uniref:cilia- and flagella-associated protein 157-like n=1 Tax=Oncorhynchus masou masou TaxID=90313 RepID=UPI0031844996
MPKKNGKKSGDKSTKKEIIGFGDKTCFDDALSEGGKDFYRSQIRDLEEQLEKYQHKCDELEVQQKDFSSQYFTVEKEKKDIVLYLKRSLAQKEDELTDLLERLVGLQQAKDAEKDSFELQLSQLRQEFQENKDKLTSENMVLAGKLAALEEFRVQKEELMAHLEGLEEQLGKQRQEHHTVIYSLERKAVLDNDRLKKEMQQHVAAVAAEFRRVSDRKMPETTMRAIHENVSVTAQLSQLSDKSKQLLEENEDLRDKEKHIRREMEVLEPLFNKMTRKSLSNQKVIHQLTEKCKQMQAELEEYARAQEEHQQLQKDHVVLLAEMHALRQVQASLLEETGRNCAEANRLGRALEEERDVRGQLEAILQAAAFALKQALMEVPKEEDSEVKTLVRRNQMMQKLLAVLDSAARLGKGPAMKDFIPEGDSLHEPKTGPGPGRSSGLLGPLLKDTTQLSHFKTGDLGLVPRRTHNYNNILSKMGPLSKSTRLQLHRKVSPPQKRTSPSKPSGPESLAPPLRDPPRGSLLSPHRPSPTRGSAAEPILR